MALIEKLTAIADAIREKTGTTETMTLDQMASAISGISGGGGSAEIPTCTVKFVVGADAAANDLVVYTKHEEGITSVVNIDGTTPYENQSEYILENVVCGSIIYFAWYYNTDEGDIQIDGGADQIINSFNAENEAMLFKAQSEPDTVSTITVDGFTGLLPEW